MILFNFYFAWIWLLLGLLAGSIIGLFFHGEEWLGGYDSWPRRMLRLGHISFFGTGFLNFMLYFSTQSQGQALLYPSASYFLILGAFAMPLICFLSAWHKPFRHLFFVPVTCLILGVALYIGGNLWS